MRYITQVRYAMTVQICVSGVILDILVNDVSITILDEFLSKDKVRYFPQSFAICEINQLFINWLTDCLNT